MGNICRSPAAECVFRQFAGQAGLGSAIQCDSAGTIEEHQGESPDRRMRQAGQARGYRIAGSARAVTKDDLFNFDLVLAMDRDNLAVLQGLERRHGGEARIRLFGTYVDDLDGGDIPDPYWSEIAGFEHVLDLIESGCRKLLASVRSDQKNRGNDR